MIIPPHPSSASSNPDAAGLPSNSTAALLPRHLWRRVAEENHIFFTLLPVNTPSLELPPHDLSGGLDETACWARFVLMLLARPFAEHNGMKEDVR